MKIINEIKTMAKDKKIDIYVDMDGVIAEYDFGRPLDFLNKRPLLGNIKVLEEIQEFVDKVYEEMNLTEFTNNIQIQEFIGGNNV